MKKIIIATLVMISCFYMGQVGIGTTTPNPSAILDVDVNAISPKKGFLLPRVNLTDNTDITTIPSPVTGLTAYNETTSGSGNNLIKANSLVVWNTNSWESVSNLPEIISLKVPINYVLSSKNQQNFTTTGELASANSSVPVIIELQPGDVYVDNPNDVQLTGNTFRFLTDSYYQFSGAINFRANVNVSGDPTEVIIALQSSMDGITWNSIFANATPIEKNAADKTQTISFPNFVHHFSPNELLRIVIYKPASASSYAANSGIIVNVAGTDIAKSFRIIRIQQ